MPRYTFPNGHVIEAQTESELVELVRRYSREKYSYEMSDEDILHEAERIQ